MSDAVELRDETWDRDVLKASGPVVVDFWAPWCGPCRRFGPVVDDVAKTLSGQVVVGKLNVDENEATARRYDVRSIPTLVVFRDGRIVERRTGFLGKDEVVRLATSHLIDSGA